MGEIAALATAFCWAVTSTSFEYAGKKIGSLNLNLLRLLMGFGFLCIFTAITRGMPLPIDADVSIWLWLSLSGIIGLVIGDLLLLEALLLIGARISMLIYASSPIFSGIFAWIILGEAMSGMEIIGMMVTLAGITLVMLKNGDENTKIKLAHPIAGILLAAGAAIGQALGYAIGKLGMASYNAFAATQIRTLSAIAAFVIIFLLKGQFKSFFTSLGDKKSMQAATLGSFFGPFIGVSLSLYAAQRINPGVASTLMSITPIILIVYAVIFKKEKVAPREIIGSITAVAGLAIMFI